ncbi:alpha/beta fold hydrolase [Kordiimonas sp. SCSIO 12610]|uniref:alpha/beta fold hydrolase n=1 Tax=Kordiimonas sp. SCSIO 12610 TaxID=2829597 RepID=UPI00210E6368|nr:alpha/beta hydrolase [Kordiimonas sp. SCSIO 12610]UTW56020.1 alpha/beta hydrolase [Kordiimonas sp. SCSIO 12610]
MKIKSTIIMAVATCSLFTSNLPATEHTPNAGAYSNEKPIVFEAQSGEKVDAFEGYINVPENRNAPNSRSITLKYVRFPATSDTYNVPTIYLAGGPGGSGISTAKYRRFSLFMTMREFGDVIALDQRGTGLSNDLPECKSSIKLGTSKIVSDQEYNQLHQRAFKECLAFWKNNYIDIYGYNTVESAADLNDLRLHMGSEKVNLWGISYGSHLTLAALKQMSAHINRVVFTATEGLEQTIKLPARSDLYFDRLQSAINADDHYKSKYPDVTGLIRRVLKKAEEKPILVNIPMQDGTNLPFLLQKRDLQQFIAGMAADPVRMMWMLGIIEALDSGDTAPMLNLLSRFIRNSDNHISFSPMSSLMDVASGTSSKRRALILEQAETAIVGLNLNDTLMLEGIDTALDLGDEFRRAPQSNVPALVFTGTLDGRTFPKSAVEATSGLSNKQAVTVINGGHNLFMLSPEVTKTIQDFMRGENVNGREIFIPLPKE